MGKYPESKLLALYSDWHWDNAEWCSMTDLDYVLVDVGGRLQAVRQPWIELRKDRSGKDQMVAIIDIKEPGAQVTKAQRFAYNEFQDRFGLPVYIVHPEGFYKSNGKTHFKRFTVAWWKSRRRRAFTERGFIRFLKGLPFARREG